MRISVQIHTYIKASSQTIQYSNQEIISTSNSHKGRVSVLRKQANSQRQQAKKKNRKQEKPKTLATAR